MGMGGRRGRLRTIAKSRLKAIRKVRKPSGNARKRLKAIRKRPKTSESRPKTSESRPKTSEKRPEASEMNRIRQNFVRNYFETP